MAWTDYYDREVPKETYDGIAAMISSDESPVGIDAKKTHIIIINKLIDIQRRLEKIESITGA